uniref:hypothetical protein n=1 Tax=Burkholderia ambifaria TaxID=152480 RepID=UPI001ABA0F0F
VPDTVARLRLALLAPVPSHLLEAKNRESTQEPESLTGGGGPIVVRKRQSPLARPIYATTPPQGFQLVKPIRKRSWLRKSERIQQIEYLTIYRSLGIRQAVYKPSRTAKSEVFLRERQILSGRQWRRVFQHTEYFRIERRFAPRRDMLGHILLQRCRDHKGSLGSITTNKHST